MDLVLIIDLVLVGLIVLFSIIGLIKGFFKSLLDFFGTIVSLIISILLAQVVAGALIRIPPVDWLFGSTGVISSAIGNGLSNLSESIFSTPFSTLSNAEELAALLTAGGIPSFLSPILAGVVSQFNFASSVPDQSLTLAQILAPMIANVIFLIVVVILLFILLKIILSQLNRLFKFLTKNKAISGLNRLFGFIVGAFKGALVAAVALIVVSFLPNTGIIASFNASLENTALAKHFNSFLYDAVTKNIDLDKLIDGLFPGAKKMTEKEIALYAILSVDFTAEGRRPSDFLALDDGGTAKDAVQHFADHNRLLLSAIGGNGFSDGEMDGFIASAEALRIKTEALFAALAEYNDSAAADGSAVTLLLGEIDAHYPAFNAFAEYAPFFS